MAETTVAAARSGTTQRISGIFRKWYSQGDVANWLETSENLAKIRQYHVGSVTIDWFESDWVELEIADCLGRAAVADDGQNLVTVAPIPPPATALLLVGALGGLGALRRRRRA